MSTYKRKEPPCAETSPSPMTSPTPTAAPSSIPSPATAPTASTAENAPGGPDEETAGRAYRSTTGMVYAVRKHSDEMFRIMCHYDGEEWMLATSPQFSAPCRCAESLQEVLDAYASRIGWKEIETECKEKNPAAALTPAAAATAAAPAAAPAETLTTSESEADASRCRASTSGAAAAESLSDQPSPAGVAPATQNPSNVTAACSAADGRHSQIVEHQPPLIQPETIYVSPNGIRYKIAVVAVDKQQCFHTERFVNGRWSAANSSVYKNLRDANGEFEAWIRTEKLKPEVAAAAIVPASNAASEIVDAGSELDTPAFDYSGLDKQTVADLHLAEREYASGKRLAEAGLRRMVDGVAIAHDALCGGVVANCDNSKHGNRGEDTFRRFCSDVLGVSKDTAYRLLQVSGLFERSSPKEQKVLAELAPSLLYAAAKPSAPEELVQAVKSGDITTHKQYQELLKQYQDTLTENQQLRYDRVTALNNAERAEKEREQAIIDRDTARDAQTNSARLSNMIANQRDEARRRADEAEKQRDAAQQTAQDAQARIRELESRPLEVVGASPEDIAKWRAEGAASVQPSLKKAQTEKTAAENSAKEARRELERLKDAIDDYLSPQQASAQQAYLAANTIRGLFRSWCADALHWQLALEEVAAPLYHVSTEISAAILGGHNIAPTDAGTEEDAEREAIFE